MPGETTYTVTIKKDGATLSGFPVSGCSSAAHMSASGGDQEHIAWTKDGVTEKFILGPGYSWSITAQTA